MTKRSDPHTKGVTRRDFLTMAGAIGATALWGADKATKSTVKWAERRDLYPEGVASGDPTSDSVLLWTRRPFDGTQQDGTLTVEVAADQAFRRVVVTSKITVSQDA